MEVKAKKALGQHFLTDQDIARRIAETLTPPQPDPSFKPEWMQLPILEVGPGMGVLTQYLKGFGRELKVVEIDDESVSYLKKASPGLEIIEGDFLRMKLDEIFGGKEFALIGNYPYNISSQIFFKLLDYKEYIPVCSGMLQREVAQRICSGPGSKAYGILSVLLQAWYDCQYLFTVDETVFTPQPKVKSGVIRLTRNSRTDLGCDPALFKTIVKTTFGQRRKTLRNSMAPFINKTDPRMADLLANPILSKRPEQLSVEDFIFLTNAVKAK